MVNRYRRYRRCSADVHFVGPALCRTRSAGRVDTEAVPAALRARLAKALERAFNEPDPSLPRRTRAVVIVHRGKIVAERYADGFDARTRMPGWSMAKSATSAWVGALAMEGRLRLDEPLALEAWRGASDARSRISFRHALNMTNGLAFTEAYTSPFSDVNRMLFFSADMPAYAAQQASTAEPGERFQYASGSTNLISRAVRERLASDYAVSPYRALFDRIGMRSAVFESDASGTYVGSSYLFANTRDWARLGLLYLRDGEWNGQRILPEGWVAFSTSATPASPSYGAHWWLHEPSANDARALPSDLYQATGFAGQRITVVPSRDLVIVRLGLGINGAPLRHADLIHDVVSAIE